jgi:hypothetical protein
VVVVELDVVGLQPGAVAVGVVAVDLERALGARTGQGDLLGARAEPDRLAQHRKRRVPGRAAGARDDVDAARAVAGDDPVGHGGPAGVGRAPARVGGHRGAGLVVAVGDQVPGQAGQHAVRVGGRHGRCRGERRELAAARHGREADPVGHQAFPAVGRRVPDARRGLAFGACQERRRAAAVEVDRVVGAEALQVPRQLQLGHPAAVGLASVHSGQPQALAVGGEADRGARCHGDVVDRLHDAVAEQDFVAAHGDRDLPGVRARRVRDSDGVARLERREGVRPGFAGQQQRGARRDRAVRGLLAHGGDHAVAHLHLAHPGRSGHRGRAARSTPQRRVDADRVAVEDGAVEVRGLHRAAGERHGGFEEDRSQLRLALVGDRGRVVVAGRGRGLQLPVVDADADRRAGGVDVEEVAVDAGDRTGPRDLLRKRRARGHRAGAQIRGRQDLAAQVDGEGVAADPAGRVEPVELGEVQAGRDLGGRAAGDEPVVGIRDGEGGRALAVRRRGGRGLDRRRAERRPQRVGVGGDDEDRREQRERARQHEK